VALGSPFLFQELYEVNLSGLFVIFNIFPRYVRNYFQDTFNNVRKYLPDYVEQC
jgi:hypothetical protein